MYGYGGGGGGGGARRADRFEHHYQCYSTAFSGKSGIDDGDKVLLPASALDSLARMNVDYPMLFRLEHEEILKTLHCGVLEFTAEEGHCYMPFWMMQNLMIDEGNIIKVTNVALPKATFVKFRAQSVDFLEISNPKAALEVTLRKFTCLTVGEMIRITYIDKSYQLEVVELQPSDAASIIETDCITDFAEPVGYVEPKRVKPGDTDGEGDFKVSAGAVRVPQKARTATSDAEVKFHAFGGQAKRIDGKDSTKDGDVKPVSTSTALSAATVMSSSSGSVFGGLSGGGLKLAGSALAGGGSSSSSSSSSGGSGSGGGGGSVGAASAASSSPSIKQPQSKIGDQFSKKKAVVSAFGGPAHKLA